MKTKYSKRPVPDLDVFVSADDVDLFGELEVPAGARGVILFAHGSGSSRFSPRNQHVARILRNAGIGTLLFDLLTREDEEEDAVTGALRFDIKLLAKRLLGATIWLEGQPEAKGLKLGYFGASTGAAAALMASAALGDRIAAVVSRGGRPDLARDALPNVKSPTLLIVGGMDDVVMQLNEEAYAKLRCEKELRIVPGASHLFSETGKLEEVARMSAEWFLRHMNDAC
jgi:putative phosphoribosyl transferase